MSEVKFVISLDSRAFKSGSEEVKAQVRRITEEVKVEGGKMQREFDGIGKSMGSSMGKYLAAFGGAAVFKQLIGDMVRVRGEFQKADTAIRTMLGSKEKADELMSQVRDYAKISPLEFSDITKATQTMLSFDVEAAKVPGYIKAIGDISMGESGKFQQLSLAFSQMSATGKLMGQDLLQMINAGFNPLAVIAEKTGKSIAQLKDEMSKGKISAQQVQQAFIDATSAGGKFFNMSENAAKTIEGQMSMLSDAVDAAFNEVGTKSEGIITGAISGVTKLVENYEAVAKAIGFLIANYGVYKTAVITVTAVEQAHGIAAAAAAAKTSILKVAQDALNKSMLANPYVAAAVALSALVSAIVAAATATDAFDEAQKSLEEAAAGVDASTASEMSKLDALYKKLLEAEEGSEAYKKIKQQIIDQYSQYYAGLEAEWEKVGNLALMYDKLTDAIRKSIAARQLKSFVDKQMDANDKVVQEKLDDAYKKLIDKYGKARGTKLYKKFFKFATQGDGKDMDAQDWKDLEKATMWTTRWGKNATDGIVDFRVSVKELAYDIQKSNKATLESIELYKEMYGITEEIKEETTTPTKEPTYTDPKELARQKRAAEKAARDRARIAKEQADEYDKIAEIHLHQMTEQGRKSADLELEVREAEIRAMRQGTKKTLAEIELARDKEITSVTRWYEDLRQKRIDEAKKLWDAQKKNEGKKFYESEEYKKASSNEAYTDEENNAFKKRMAAANQVYANSLKEIQDNETAALTSFLREYGTYQQQRLAIAQEYAKKIEKAETEGERLTLRAEEREAYRSLDFDQFKKSINWEAVFSDLDGVSLEHLNTLKEQLQGTLKDGTLSATDYKTVVEQIGKIEKAIVAKQNEWKNVLGLTIPELEKRKRLEQEAVDAQQRAVDLQRLQAEAQKRLTSAKTTIQAALNFKIDAEDIKVENAQEILNKFTPDTEIYKTLTRLFGNLADAEHDLSATTEEYNTAQADAVIKTEKAQKTLTSAIAAINEIAQKVNANIQSTVDLIETLGLGDSAFGKGFGDFADAAQSMSDAFSALQNGNIMGVMNGVLSSVGSLGQALGKWGIAGMGDSDKTLAEDMERLTESNEALKRSVDDLTDEMSESAVADAGEIYKQLQSNLEQSQRNTQEMLRRMGGAYNNGFLGIGGKGSSNSKINEGVNSSEWQRVSQIVGKSVTSASQFWSLTSEQMHKVAKDAPEVYAHIKQLAADGYQDAAQYMDDYIEYWRELEEAAEAYAEKITGVSLDSVVGDFQRMLADMDSSAADFADDFEQYLQNAIIGALVSDTYEPLIKQWYESFRKAAETDGIDQAERDALQRDWDRIVGDALRDREQLREQFGWGSTGEGSGAYKAVASFTQEQGDELNGRLTAIQIGLERENQSLSAAVSALQGLSVVTNAQGTTLNEMRNLLLIGNGHLEDIARYTKIASQYGDAIETIANKIKEL